MSKTVVGKCVQPGCNAPIDGECIEGFEELTKCPHYSLDTQETDVEDGLDEDETEDSTDEDRADPEIVKLPGGDELTFRQSSVVTTAELARVVVLAGESESGKTTLLSTLITKFQRGPFAGYDFAGSLTLIGFEKRCHLARSASGLTKPDTERTKPEVEEKMLHLRVRAENAADSAKNILFTDISGEKFERMQDYTAECKEFEVLLRADHFVLLIDGKKLADPARRQQAFIGGMLILRSCVESGMLGSHSFVDVLFTKYDLIRNAKDVVRNAEFLDRIQQQIAQDYQGKFRRLRFFKIAVRYTNPDALGADNFAGLFSTWVEDTPIYLRRFKSASSEVKVTSREFDQYLSRRLPINNYPR